MTRIDQASRRIRATPHEIYRAMTDPVALCTWLPPTGMSAKMLAFDLRPGGGYRMVLRYDDAAVEGKSGGNEDIAEVRYRDLVPNRLLAQEIDFVSDDPSFSGTMRMDWTIAASAEGAEVTIRATGVPRGINAVDHQAGMTSSLENLVRFVERPSR